MWPLRTISCIVSLSRTFLGRNTKIRRVDLWKNGFYQITRYLFSLGHMLLHKLYINVAIANDLQYFLLSRTFQSQNTKNFSVDL